MLTVIGYERICWTRVPHAEVVQSIFADDADLAMVMERIEQRLLDELSGLLAALTAVRAVRKGLEAEHDN